MSRWTMAALSQDQVAGHREAQREEHTETETVWTNEQTQRGASSQSTWVSGSNTQEVTAQEANGAGLEKMASPESPMGREELWEGEEVEFQV